MTLKELYILISDKCNFACAHCLNSSGPKADRWMLSDQDIIKIAEEINADQNISCVHFYGGEPTLFLDKIISLQSKISRKIKYSITTNGWFWENPEQVTSKITLDEVVLSFDRFRKPFISKDQLVALAAWLQTNGYKVTINYLVTKIDDFTSINDFSLPGIKVLINGTIKSGRYNPDRENDNYKDDKWMSHTCPSVSTVINLREAEKVNLLPKQGYSPCCGPLVYDELADKTFTSSASIEQYNENTLRSKLIGKSFKEQFSESGYTVDSSMFNSACEACAVLYGANEDLPSLYDLSKPEPSLKFYKSKKSINKKYLKLAEQINRSAYVFLSNEIILKSHLKDLPELENIREEVLDDDNLNSLIKFIEDNYYRSFPEQYSEFDIELFKKGLPWYMSLKPTGKLYFKNNEIVGCFMANRFDNHPMLDMASVHIGYWGYKHSALTKNEINYLKNSWLKNLIPLAQKGDVFNATIRLHNERSINYIKKIGFFQHGVRFDLRGKP